MLPVLGIGLLGGLIGLGAHAVASEDNRQAQENIETANNIVNRSNELANTAKDNCQYSIDQLAINKANILRGNMRRFVNAYSKIKPVNFKNTDTSIELSQFSRNQIVEVDKMCSSVQKLTASQITGGVSGTLLAVGALNSVAASTALGIGSAAAGSLLSTFAAPVFAISGIFSAAEAAENLEKSQIALSEARAFEDECETFAYVMGAIEDRCDMVNSVLVELDENWFSNAVVNLEKLVNDKKTFKNFLLNLFGQKTYTSEEIVMVSEIAALAKMIKTLIDVNIIDSDGDLTYESEEVVENIQNRMDSGLNETSLSTNYNSSSSNYYTSSKQSTNVSSKKAENNAFKQPSNIKDTVINVISDQLDIRKSRIDMDSDIYDDLEADELDMVDIVIALEEVFDIEIPDYESDDMYTVGDIVDYIEWHI